jgi:hypothetical protein
VSAYESGARQPSLPTLERLVRAAGCELDITVRAPRAQVLAGPVGQKLLRHRRKVRDIIARHGLSSVRVFGSVARGERDLEALLGVPVDLVPADDLKPAVAA